MSGKWLFFLVVTTLLAFFLLGSKDLSWLNPQIAEQIANQIRAQTEYQQQKQRIELDFEEKRRALELASYQQMQELIYDLLAFGGRAMIVTLAMCIVFLSAVLSLSLYRRFIPFFAPSSSLEHSPSSLPADVSNQKREHPSRTEIQQLYEQRLQERLQEIQRQRQ